MNRVRSLVRPTVTWGLVAAQIGLAFGWFVSPEVAEKPFAALSPFTMLAMRDWFASREAHK